MDIRNQVQKIDAMVAQGNIVNAVKFFFNTGAKFRVDPNKFIVSNNKYYLFLNNLELDAKQL